MFRPVRLPEVSGRLLLSSMPGRDTPWPVVRGALAAEAVVEIVCLAPPDEIEDKSPEYAAALRGGAVMPRPLRVPVPDYGVPRDETEYLAAVRQIAVRLQEDGAVLVHCAAGVGRTGTFAVCVLLALGIAAEEAETRVEDAGSGPETDEQRRLIRRLRSQIRGG